jgi:nitroreductase
VDVTQANRSDSRRAAIDILEAIHTRRSTRDFTDAQVSADKIDTLVRAAMAAPSAHNERPWRFVIVRDPDTLAALSHSTPWAAPIGRAPLGIVLFADTSALKSHSGLPMLDCALAGENMMLAALSEGLGTVWLAAWPFAEYVSSIKAILGAPDEAVAVAMFAVGVPEKAPASIDRFEPDWIYSERYDQR